MLAAVVGGLILVAVHAASCTTESFPDMQAPSAGAGGVRGHVLMRTPPHLEGLGEADYILLCSQKWELRGNGDRMGADCPGFIQRGDIDYSQDGLFFVDDVEPGQYWLVATDVRDFYWYMLEGGGHRVTVAEGEWTNAGTFELSPVGG